MPRYVVQGKYQVNVAGRLLGPGEQFEAEPSDEIRSWLAVGYVAEAKARKGAEDKAASGGRQR